jgi:RNA polymerase sigma factor (TIGR02999 family)
MSSFAQVYAQLKVIAHRALLRQLQGTLDTTALVHEAYLKLAGYDLPSERGHLINTVARSMRMILVDAARKAQSEKHGKLLVNVTLERVGQASNIDVDMLDLDLALNELRASHERLATVFEYRYFAGAELLEIADLLNITARTVQRDFALACAILRERLAA